jgi:hypothetical protein
VRVFVDGEIHELVRDGRQVVPRLALGDAQPVDEVA